MPYPILAARNTWYKGSCDRTSITKISIVDNYSVTGNEEESWNADSTNTGSIKCYRTGTELTIAGNGSGKIAMNEDSTAIFGAYKEGNNTTLGFSNTTEIFGLSLLDSSHATTLFRAFDRCSKLVSVNGIDTWDVSNVTNMSTMFQACSNLESLLVSGWNVSNVTSLDYFLSMGNEAYQNAKLTELDLSNWNLSSCINLKQFITLCTGLTSLNVSNWDTSKVLTMSHFVYTCTELLEIIGISDWDTSSCTKMSYMFYGCKKLKELDLHTWDVSKVTTMSGMFGCPAANNSYGSTGTMERINVTGWDVSSCTDMSNMFKAQGKLVEVIGIETWKGTSACTNMGWMFWTCSSLKKIDMSNFDTSNVVSFHHLFAHCGQLKEIIGLENLNTGSAVTVNAMLHSVPIVTLDISKWNTSKLEDFTQFVESCSKLEEIIGLEKIDTSNLRSCQQMFQGCTKLKRLNLSTFDTRRIRGRQLEDGETTYWKDPYRPNDDDFGSMTVMFGTKTDSSDSRTRSLKEIIIGPNFSFEGAGNLKQYNAAAKLWDPDPGFISETRGLWYNVDTLQSYTSAEIPNNVAATYSCVGVDVLIKHTTLIDIAEEVKRLNGSTEKIKPSDMVTILSKLELGSG